MWIVILICPPARVVQIDINTCDSRFSRDGNKSRQIGRYDKGSFFVCSLISDTLVILFMLGAVN